STQEANSASGAGRAAEPSRPEGHDARAMPAVQEPEAPAPGVPALRHFPRPSGHSHQDEADGRLAPSDSRMKIAVDAMGGDHAPDDIVRGALLYRDKGGAAELILVGREQDV